MSARTTRDHGIPYVEILGVKLHSVSWAEALAHLETFIQEGTPHHVVTVNPEFVMTAQEDKAFREVLQGADLSVADGVGLLLAARMKGERLPDRVTGTDSVVRLAELSARNGYRLFFLGAAPGVADIAVEKLSAQFPGMVCAGTWSGSPAQEEEEDIIAMVKEARPDVLFVAWGAPRQDLWIARNLERLGVPVCMGVGGAFDFHAGIVRRAPVLMQRTGTEWLFRLVTQPTRARRMMALPRFALKAMREAL